MKLSRTLNNEILEPFPFPSITRRMSPPISVTNTALQILVQTTKYKNETGVASVRVMFSFT